MDAGSLVFAKRVWDPAFGRLNLSDILDYLDFKGSLSVLQSYSLGQIAI
jgi:hypothetical protein